MLFADAIVVVPRGVGITAVLVVTVRVILLFVQSFCLSEKCFLIEFHLILNYANNKDWCVLLFHVKLKIFSSNQTHIFVRISQRTKPHTPTAQSPYTHTPKHDRTLLHSRFEHITNRQHITEGVIEIKIFLLVLVIKLLSQSIILYIHSFVRLAE